MQVGAGAATKEDRRPPAKRALSELVLVAAGKTFGLLALFATGILIARQVGPATYGLYSAGLALALLVDAILGSPVDMATVRYGALHSDDPQLVAGLQAAAFRLKLMLWGALLLLVPLRDVLASGLFGAPEHSGLLSVAMLCALALLVIRSTGAFLQVDLRFALYAALDGVQGVFRLVAVGTLVLAGAAGPEPYLVAYGGASALVFVAAAVAVRQPFLTASLPERRSVLEVAGYVGTTTAVVVLGTITGRSDVLILSAVQGAEATGYYAAAAQVAMAVTMLAGYAAVVTQPRVIPMARQGRLISLVSGSFVGAAVVATAVGIGAFTVAEDAVSILFGESYGPMVPILQILLIGSCADLFTLPVVFPFGLQLQVRASLVGEAVIAAIFALTISYGADLGGIGVAWVMSGVRLLKLAFYTWLTWSRRRDFRVAGEISRSAREPGVA